MDSPDHGSDRVGFHAHPDDGDPAVDGGQLHRLVDQPRVPAALDDGVGRAAGPLPHGGADVVAQGVDGVVGPEGGREGTALGGRVAHHHVGRAESTGPGGDAEADRSGTEHGHRAAPDVARAAHGAAGDRERFHQRLVGPGHRGGQREELPAVARHQLGEAPGPLEADELERRAMVGTSGPAPAAGAAPGEGPHRHRSAEGPVVDAVAEGLDGAGDLVAEGRAGSPHHGGDVEVAAADATAGDPHDHLARRGTGSGRSTTSRVGGEAVRTAADAPLLDHDDGRAVVA